MIKDSRTDLSIETLIGEVNFIGTISVQKGKVVTGAITAEKQHVNEDTSTINQRIGDCSIRYSNPAIEGNAMYGGILDTNQQRLLNVNERLSGSAVTIINGVEQILSSIDERIAKGTLTIDNN